MKFFIGLLIATILALDGVLSLPARNPSDDAEVIGYPRRVSTKTDADDDDDFKDFKGIIDTGSGYPFLQPNPSILNFGFFDSFEDIFRRFSSRLRPTTLFGLGADDDSDEDSGSGGIGITTNFDPKKGNTTSTVKVVDGHKVEVNETVYGDEHSVFKVRVVNVRPLEEGETVEETVNKDGDQTPSIKPVTSSPEKAADSEEEDEGRREPLAKKPNDNEIERNIDGPEHSTVTENIVEATTSYDDEDEKEGDSTMLPTTTEEVAFVTDNSLAAAAGEEELNANENINGNGNNEFETNMSDGGNANDDDEGGDDDDAIATATDIAATIENNEDTEEVNDNLNESSSADDDDAAAQASSDNNKTSEFEEVEDTETIGDDVVDDMAGKIVNSNVKHSNYAAIRNKQREDASSSDDEDEDAAAVMHPTFNDEWGSYNEHIGDNKENNDLSNDIDVYDVEPIDLSNDIAVNYAPNLPLNPDAEFIDVYGSKQALEAMPKFEKLSLTQMPDDEHSSSFSGEMK